MRWKILSLEIAADDYLVKPVSSRELVARIRAILRRTARKRVRHLRFGETELIRSVG